MAVFARSDVMSVSLSESHGGCGAVHSRPVTRGVPDKVWALSCPRCENHLRSDAHWASMLADVPETPDEVRVREDVEKRGVRDRDTRNDAMMESLTTSLAMLTQLVAQGVKLPPDVQERAAELTAALHPDFPGADPDADPDTEVGQVPAPEGEPQDEGAAEGVEAAEGGGESTPDADDSSGAENASTGELPAPSTLQKMLLGDLQVLARERGVDDSGTKADIIARLTS